MELEQMWVLDLQAQKYRGFAQGYHRGLYKDYDWGGEKLLQNELGKVFQVTGALNSLAAIYYDEAPGDDEHALWFDFYNEVGLNIGKVMRWTLAFDPKELH